MRDPRCDGCGSTCAGCRPNRDPVLLAGILSTTDTLPRTRPGTTCESCGAPARWHPTPLGRWLLLDPAPRPIAQFPPGKRWRLAGDGTAVNLRDASPTDTCHICHFDICPSNPPPSNAPLLLHLWHENARRSEAGE